MRFSSTAAAMAAMLLTLAARPAAAQDENPWAKGVSPEAQKTALALFREGNAALKDGVFGDAAAKYREALGHWDHPAIHYNLALSLRTLDQPLEQREHLVSAMKYGADPLDAAKFTNAKLMLDLVEKQLARVQIRCSEEGAQVVMDGKQLFTAPGQFDDYVRPGPHSIVSTKTGFLTYQVSKALPFGELSTFEIKLFKAADLTKYKRRWTQAVPYGVLVAGLVVGLAGGGLHYGAKASYDSFDKAVETGSGGQPGMIPTADLTAKRSAGDAMQGVAIGCYGVGGAAVVAGAVLLYMNRLIPYQDTAPAPEAPKKDGEKAAAPEWSVVPLLGPDATGVSATFRF
ncbi:MAG TPA: hypothetical protein VGK67_05590 [Myxococcales bacterium]